MADASVSTRDLGVTLLDTIQRFESYGALETFLYRNLGQRLNLISERSKGLELVSADVLTWAQSKGETRFLLVRLAAIDPGNAVLARLIADMGIDPAAYPPKLVAFEALQDGAANPVTREVIGYYRDDIDQLCDLAIEVRDWKFLHDGVDQIRNRTYVPMLAHTDAKPMQREQVEEVQFMNNIWTGKIVGRADAMTAAGTMVDDDREWINERLIVANARLAEAVPKWPSKPDFDFVMMRLGMMTTADLGLLNQHIITGTAKIAGLKILDKLAKLKASVTALGPDTKAIVADIAVVEAAVALVLERDAIHNRWQKIKNRLAPLRRDPRPTDPETAYGWQVLRPLIIAAADRPEMTDLICGRIDAALADPASITLPGSFETLGGLIDQRFFAADKELLVAAEALGQIGSELKAMLETLDG